MGWLLQFAVLLGLMLFGASTPARCADVGAFSNKIAEFRIDNYRGMPKVRVTFGSADYAFAADTGSSITSFEPELLPLLGRIDEQSTLLGAHAAVDLPIYRSPEGRIGDARLRPLTRVFCFEHKMNRIRARRINGVLGVDALRDFVMRVDFDAGVVAFLRSLPREPGRRVAVDLRNGRPMVSAALGGVPVTFVLDTGSDCYGAGQMRKREFDEFLRRGTFIGIDEIPVATDFGVSVRRAAVASVPFMIGGFAHVGFVFCDFQPVDARHQANTLGIGFLRRFIVTFDFPNSAVYLSPGAQFRKIDASRDPGGVRLAREGKKIVVTHILTSPVVSAPVPEAGVQVGDALETVNGIAVNGLNDAALARALSDTTQPTSLQFRRPSIGTVVHVRFDEREVRRHLLDRYNSSPPKLDGSGTPFRAGGDAPAGGANLRRAAQK